MPPHLSPSPTPQPSVPSAPEGEPPDASAAVDAPAVPRCANCGTPAGDAYCPHCGQEQRDYHRSLRSIADELLDSLAGWDGKIPSTLWLLVRRPGALTAEFLAGRRARYLRPLRLYLVLSLVYFVVLSLDWPGEDGRGTRHVDTSVEPDGNFRVRMGRPPSARDSARVAATRAARADSAARARTDSITRTRADSIATAVADSAAEERKMREALQRIDTTTARGRIELTMVRRVLRFQRIPEAERNRAFLGAFFGQLPNVVFALVPFVALLLRVAYRRAPLFYAEHFVHALHLHAFGMLAMTVVHVTPGAWSAIPFLALPVYAWLALRRVYGGSALRTTVKLAFVGGTYLVAVTTAVSVLALVILFFVI